MASLKISRLPLAGGCNALRLSLDGIVCLRASQVACELKGAASVFFSVMLADTKVHLDGCLLFLRWRHSVLATSCLPDPGLGSAAA